MLERESELRPLPVRLCDIKPLVRLRAARTVASQEPNVAYDVLAAAINPSRTVYWVEADALSTLLKVAA